VPADADEGQFGEYVGGFGGVLVDQVDGARSLEPGCGGSRAAPGDASLSFTSEGAGVAAGFGEEVAAVAEGVRPTA
jgi:hypothetical protein